MLVGGGERDDEAGGREEGVSHGVCFCSTFSPFPAINGLKLPLLARRTHTHVRTRTCSRKTLTYQVPITSPKLSEISNNALPVGGARCGVKSAQTHFHTALHVSKRYA